MIFVQTLRKKYSNNSDPIYLILREHLEDGFKRFEVDGYINDEVLSLCEKLCNCKFESIKKMLSDNWYYKTIIK